MSRNDLAAIATYLKDAEPAGASTRKPIASDDPAMRAGQTIYVDHCTACHGPEGASVAQLFPALKASPSVQSLERTSLIRVVLQGAQRRHRPRPHRGVNAGFRLEAVER